MRGVLAPQGARREVRRGVGARVHVAWIGGCVWGEGMWVVWVAWAVRSKVGHALAASHPMGGYSVQGRHLFLPLGICGEKITRERGMGTFSSPTLPDLHYAFAPRDADAGR